MNTSRTPVVLSSGDDPKLLRIRTLVLENAGFDVVACTPEEVVRRLSERQDIQAAVLCHSIELGERVALARDMRRQFANVAIVMMYLADNMFDASDCDA